MQNATQLNLDTSIASTPVIEAQSTEPLKRRVHQTSQRHGKAFGNAGVVSVSYVQGFAKGFMSAFSEK